MSHWFPLMMMKQLTPFSFSLHKVCLMLFCKFYLVTNDLILFSCNTCTKWEFLPATMISSVLGWHSANFEVVESHSLRRFCFLLCMWRGMVVKVELCPCYWPGSPVTWTAEIFRAESCSATTMKLCISLWHFSGSVFSSVKLEARMNYVFWGTKNTQHGILIIGNFWRLTLTGHGETLVKNMENPKLSKQLRALPICYFSFYSLASK